jgi:hypothetical protein
VHADRSGPEPGRPGRRAWPRAIREMALMRTALAVTVAAAALAGCNGIVTYRYEGGAPSAQFYAPYAALDGTNLLVVRNNPFPNDRTNEAVLAVVRTHNPMRRYRFSLVPPPDWNGYTVILGFGLSPVGNQSQCQNAQIPLRPTPPGRTTLIVDLCYGRQLITETYGRSPAVGGAEDPTFAALVDQVMTDLLAIRQYFQSASMGSPSPIFVSY